MGYFAEQAAEQDQQQQEQEMLQAELHYTVINALKKCVMTLSAEELAAVCYVAGINVKGLS
jgi:uncharacterized membrane protein YgdD (TMEM256/DUF423 family)